jgi:hypothetical protein
LFAEIRGVVADAGLQLSFCDSEQGKSAVAIYKYLRPERIDVLENAKIRATQACALNDPFELRPYFDFVIDEADIDDRLSDRDFISNAIEGAYNGLAPDEKAAIPRPVFDQLLSQPQFRLLLEQFVSAHVKLDMVRHGPKLTSTVLEVLHQGLGSRVGIVSFCEDPLITLMWSHYGDEHRGFVIEFDEAHEFFDRRRSPSDEFFHLRPVKYANPSNGQTKMLDLDPQFLCLKREEWRYEKERRFLVPLSPDAAPGDIRLIDIPRGAISRVLFGARAEDGFVQRLRGVLGAHPEYRDVETAAVRLNPKSGGLTI